MAHQVIAAVPFVVTGTRTRAVGWRLERLVTRIVAAGVWAMVFLSSVGVAYAAKDVVITTSGDRLVGEIKKVEKEVLTISTDYSD